MDNITRKEFDILKQQVTELSAKLDAATRLAVRTHRVLRYVHYLAVPSYFVQDVPALQFDYLYSTQKLGSITVSQLFNQSLPETRLIMHNAYKTGPL